MRRMRWVLLTAGLLLALWLGLGGCGTVRAARLLEDALRPAAELAPEVSEERRVWQGTEVRLYRPRDAGDGLPAVLLCHGAVDAGAAEERFVAMARALAIQGALVATPDLESLKAFRVDRGDPGRVAGLALHLGEFAGKERVALVGISIGGSYCLVAAARPELEGRVSCVFSFGGYFDLNQLLTGWMVEPRTGEPRLYDPLVEGRRRVFLGNLESLVPARDRAPVRRGIEALLEGRDEARSAELSVRGRLVLDAARSTDPLTPEVAAALLAPMREDLAVLSPRKRPRAPVFLLHGTDDPVVPPSHLKRLDVLLRGLDARVDTHETEIFGHVDPDETPSFLRAYPLLRFVSRFLAAAGL